MFYKWTKKDLLNYFSKQSNFQITPGKRFKLLNRSHISKQLNQLTWEDAEDILLPFLDYATGLNSEVKNWLPFNSWVWMWIELATPQEVKLELQEVKIKHSSTLVYKCIKYKYVQIN